VDKTMPNSIENRQPMLTDADRLREKYRAVGEAQNHKFGEGAPGSTPPNFNLPPAPKQAAPKADAITETARPSEPVKPAVVRPVPPKPIP
jgi:hypothetical protein